MELRKIITPLTWLEIQNLLGKPVWDNEEKKWRVIDGYKETFREEKHVSFTDEINWLVFYNDSYYLEELVEED